MSLNTDIFFPVTERPLYFPRRDGRYEQVDHKAIVRTNDNADPLVLAVVPSSYKLIKHREVYDAVRPVLDAHDHSISTYYDRHGQSAYIDVQFKNITAHLGHSRHNFRAIFRNGYGDAAFSMIAGAINFFCSNGMIVGEYERAWKRHTQSLDISIAETWLSSGILAFGGMEQRCLRWLDQPAKTEEYDFALPKMVENEDHIKRLREIAAFKYQPEYGQTRFALYNTLTDYATHYKMYRSRQVSSTTEHMQRFRLLARANSVMEDMEQEFA